MYNNYYPYQENYYRGNVNYGMPNQQMYNQQMYNPSMYNQNRNFRPINTPRLKNPIKPPSRAIAPKFTLSKFLNGTQEVISTISTAIPLYTQVKPLFAGAKGLTKGLTSKLFRSRSTEAKEVITNPEIITPKEAKKKAPKTEYTYEEENSPNKPFF